MIYIFLIVLICVIDYPLVKMAINEDFKSKGENTLKGVILYMITWFMVPLITTYIVLTVYEKLK